jgi:hypothetical protein
MTLPDQIFQKVVVHNKMPFDLLPLRSILLSLANQFSKDQAKIFLYIISVG